MIILREEIWEEIKKGLNSWETDFRGNSVDFYLYRGKKNGCNDCSSRNIYKDIYIFLFISFISQAEYKIVYFLFILMRIYLLKFIRLTKYRSIW